MNAQYGPGAHQFVGKGLEPAKHRGFLSTPGHSWHCQFDQVRRSPEIKGCQRVADRIDRRAMLLVPRARAPMQRRYLIGLLRQQLCREHFGEEVMIAIPVARVIERNDKEVAALQGLQPRVAFLLASDGIAQRATQPVENGGLK